MSTFEQNKLSAIKEVATNLNVAPIREGSYLYTLIDGLYRVGEDVSKEVIDYLLDAKIDTASETEVDRFGAYLGVPRITQQYATFNSYRQDMKVVVEYYGGSPGTNVTLYEKDSDVTVDGLRVLFTEPLVHNSLYPNNYASCYVTVTDNTLPYNGSLTQDFAIDLPVPGYLSNDIKSINLVVLEPKYFNRPVEDISTYRKRLKAFLTYRNISGTSAISKVIRNTPGLYSFYVDTNTLPQTVYCMNYGMYVDSSYTSDLEGTTIPLIQLSLDDVRPYNTNFKVVPAKAVELVVNIETNSEQLTEDVVSESVGLFYQRHSLGEQSLFDNRTLEEVLNQYSINADYNFKLLYHYKGYTEQVPLTKEVLIDKGHFPRVVRINILPLQEVSGV